MIATLKKLKNFVDFKLRKHLIEALVFTKIDYCDYIYTVNISQMKKLQRVQLVACSFVYGRYATMNDIVKLRWLPIQHRRTFNISKLVYKSINGLSKACSLKVLMKENRRVLRNNNNVTVEPCNIKGTFQDDAYNSFNSLPLEIRSTDTYSSFCSRTKRYLLIAAEAGLS